jgi:putative flavoprotein involved in K+ transport
MSMDEQVKTIVIGSGQAGLAAGYYLSQRGARSAGNDSFLILDENMRTGDSWRRRWDGLRLFTPAKYNSLPGKRFPGADFYFPTKDEAAAYLEDYAGSFNLPVRHNVKVLRLSRDQAGYQVSTSVGSLRAKNVIIATGAYQKPFTPAFARELDPAIFQVHSAAYCNPQQVPAQNVLVVGAGNSGVEIALELARAGKQVWLSGRNVGRIPANRLGRILGGRPYWFLISRVLSIHTPMGRKMRDVVLHHGAPLIRANMQEVTGAGIVSAPRVKDVVSGKPELEDERALPVDGIIWATGFRPDYSWIDLPIFDVTGYPRHQRGVVAEVPGLYFTGLPFQTALSSALLGGAGSDAEYIVRKIL